MSAIKNPNARQQIEAAYNKMMIAYDMFYHSPELLRENRKIVYQAALNNYRDLCTVVVKRLMRTNPEILEDMTVLWLS